jgi:predicted AAA+ superfamily ATPase
MDENLKYFLENTIVSKAAIDNRLIHPITALRYPTRMAYVLLKKYANDFLRSGMEPRLVSLAGLRGVGKTTLLWQVASYIHSNHIKEIYFFNVNTLKSLGFSLLETIEGFQKHIIKKRFNELSSPIILLFDEVHDDENWSKTLKILYDEARSAFILCTGSSALLLNQTADLARRMRIEKIYPFKFIEFIAAKTYMENKGKMLYPEKGLSNRLKEALFYSDNSEEAISKIQNCSYAVSLYYKKLEEFRKLNYVDLLKGYVSYQNIPNFLYWRDKYTINDSILDLFKRVILEDIPKLNSTLTDHVRIERLIIRLAGSDEINPEKLGGLLGIKQQEINVLLFLMVV